MIMEFFLGSETIGYNRKPITIVIICCMIVVSYLPIGKSQRVPAILAFGDSILDTGNNNYLLTIAKANFPPYGRDFEGDVATGRFTNGKLPTDLIAEELGVKELVPPYLNPTLQTNDLLTGVSFASGSSGYDPLTARSLNVLTLQEELNLFREYINKLRSTVGENATQTIISQSLYVISAGINDIILNYFLSPVRRLQFDIPAYTTQLVNWASTFINELYNLGARRIWVFSMPPNGCLPSQRTLRGGLTRQCAEIENQASILFNNKLSSEITSLNQRLPGSRIVYIDTYNRTLNLITNPSQFGFEVVDRGCCGTGLLEVSYLCNKLNPTTCVDASKFIYWDSIHPTETTFRIMVRQIAQQHLNDL